MAVAIVAGFVLPTEEVVVGFEGALEERKRFGMRLLDLRSLRWVVQELPEGNYQVAARLHLTERFEQELLAQIEAGNVVQKAERDHQIKGGCSCKRRSVRGFGCGQALNQVAHDVFAGEMHFFGNIFLTARNKRFAIIHRKERPVDVRIGIRKKRLEAQVAACDIKNRIGSLGIRRLTERCFIGIIEPTRHHAPTPALPGCRARLRKGSSVAFVEFGIELAEGSYSLPIHG